MKGYPLPAFLKIEDGDGDEPMNVEWADEVPPDATMVVCAHMSVPLIAPDNHLGNCASCGRAIQFRPVPVTVPRVCFVCAPDWLEGLNNQQ